MWIYKTMRYDNRFDIQFRVDAVTGVIQMRVNDAMAKANGYADLAELKAIIAEQDSAISVPEWLRVDDWDSPLRMPINLN